MKAFIACQFDLSVEVLTVTPNQPSRVLVPQLYWALVGIGLRPLQLLGTFATKAGAANAFPLPGRRDAGISF